MLKSGYVGSGYSMKKMASSYLQKNSWGYVEDC